MKLEIDTFNEGDVFIMQHRMRAIDRFEFEVMSGGQPLHENLMHLLGRSVRARAAYVDGRLVCIYGVISSTMLSTTGNPWLCATDALDEKEVRRVFLANMGPELQWVCEGFDRLWNLVSAENQVAIRWLKWMGFIFDETQYDVRGYPFLRFAAGE